jgi:ferritin-like metal-binding protein YciE
MMLAAPYGEAAMKTLAEAFSHTLQDIYYAEQQLTKALPAAAKATRHAGLKKALTDHEAETREHIAILKKVFKSIGEKAAGVKCDAIDGLIKESEGVIEEASGSALNAALIGCCQAIEHYEIARYGTLKEWAKVLGHTDAHELLGQILDQEKAANHKLTNLAITSING